MSTRTIPLTDALRAWMLAHSVHENDAMRELRRRTVALPNASMQISPEQGQLLTLLVELVGARRALEIGTFTGYSAICIARGLPPDGRLITCDRDADVTTIAREFWQRAGVAERIELRLGEAVGTLDGLLADGAAGTFDFAFIDADKDHYPQYVEKGLMLLRPGGLLAIDNAFWSGRVADPANQEPSTRILRQIAALLRDDPRVTAALIPIGDGLWLARKR